MNQMYQEVLNKNPLPAAAMMPNTIRTMAAIRKIPILI